VNGVAGESYSPADFRVPISVGRAPDGCHLRVLASSPTGLQRRCFGLKLPGTGGLSLIGRGERNFLGRLTVYPRKLTRRSRVVKRTSERMESKTDQ
jgi:hypothetical protein